MPSGDRERLPEKASMAEIMAREERCPDCNYGLIMVRHRLTGPNDYRPCGRCHPEAARLAITHFPGGMGSVGDMERFIDAVEAKP